MQLQDLKRYRPTALNKQKLIYYRQQIENGLEEYALVGLRADLLFDLDQLNYEYNRLSEVNKNDIANAEAYRYTKKKANTFLISAIQKALTINEEFNTPIFSEPLLDVAKNPNIIQLKLKDNSIIPTILMDEFAGNIEEWMTAIALTRIKIQEAHEEETGRSYRPMPPDIASYIFGEKYYGSARQGKKIITNRKAKGRSKQKGTDLSDQYAMKYWRTMQWRIEELESPAPWWYILEYGYSSFENDRGGYPNPTFPPTRFIEDAQSRIKNSFSQRRNFITSKINNLLDRIIKEFNNRIKIANYLVKQVERLLKEIDDTRIDDKLKQKNEEILLKKAEAKEAENLRKRLVEEKRIKKQTIRAKFMAAEKAIRDHLEAEGTLGKLTDECIKELSKMLVKESISEEERILIGGTRLRMKDILRRYKSNV